VPIFSDDAVKVAVLSGPVRSVVGAGCVVRWICGRWVLFIEVECASVPVVEDQLAGCAWFPVADLLEFGVV
jgi:hypothetical protein